MLFALNSPTLMQLLPWKADLQQCSWRIKKTCGINECIWLFALKLLREEALKRFSFTFWASINVFTCYWGAAGTWIPVLVFCLNQVKCNVEVQLYGQGYIWSKSNTLKETLINSISLQGKSQDKLASMHIIVFYMVPHSFLKFLLASGCNGGNFHWLEALW